MRSLILVTLDSCRLDSFRMANTPFFDSLGHAYSARSHGDYTIPSHRAIFSGSLPSCEMLPGKRPMWDLDVRRFCSDMGYRTIGAAAVPFLHSSFGFGLGWDFWRCSSTANIAPLSENLAYIDRHYSDPSLIFLNVGETHFPFCRDEWNHLLGALIWPWSETRGMDVNITPDLFREMHRQQVKCVEEVDRVLGEWKAPEDAVWIVTADHGELFGEHHLFGHGHGSYDEDVTVPILSNDWDYLYQFMGGPR